MTSAPLDLTAQQRERYARHLLLPGIGSLGQRALLDAHVLVVGAGGLGSPVLTYLAGAGVGSITVIDDDLVDLSNLQRQVIHSTERVGTPKVDSAKATLAGLNPETTVHTINARLTRENVVDVLAGIDLVIDGTDNFATRYLLNDVCAALGLAYIWAAIFQFDASLSVFHAATGPCYRCLHPQAPAPGTVPSCSQGGVLGALAGHVGTAQAVEAVKLITGVGRPLIGRVATYNALEGEWDYVPLAKNPTCPTCQPDFTLVRALEVAQREQGCAIDVAPAAVAEPLATNLILPRDLDLFLANQPNAILLDVRTTGETQIVSIPGSHHIELDRVLGQPTLVSGTGPVVVYCKSGARSAQAAEILRTDRSDIYELAGGIMEWVDQVSPHEVKY